MRSAIVGDTMPTDGGLWESCQRVWRRTFAGEYAALVLLAVVYAVVRLPTEPFHRLFRLSDPRLQFPHADVERVSVPMLFIYALLVPLCILTLWALILRPAVHAVHVTFLGFVSSVFLTTFITDILKNAIGRPRPDLLARCKPALGTPRDALVSIAVCQETKHHLLHDGWRSFPSGHSSFAFSGLGYLAIFFASQTLALAPRASLLTTLACAAPLLGAALIAISRLEDYRHDHADVICGSLLGLSVAYLTWRRQYPSLLSSECDMPYPPTSSRGPSPPGIFRTIRDEEEGLIEERSR
ncbi:PAP2-domain-containing protein [Piedraia hortae CBS 480.64]|uniref:PAP2-domain-containing protein n=1 Tax=Piedraia hortae CBS 480.64 TaxID=1314780 RepID=A0A6A7BRT7_9PEZI|nr:PAP2-domain-containing protein [Piedraia hortae CBS 480.64]